jgi:hypothetical protein
LGRVAEPPGGIRGVAFVRGYLADTISHGVRFKGLVEDIGFQTHNRVGVRGSGSLPGLGGFVAGCPCSVRERGANPCYSSRLAGPEIVV